MSQCRFCGGLRMMESIFHFPARPLSPRPPAPHISFSPDKPGFCKNRPPWMNESDCGTRGDRKACVCTCSKHPGSSREDQVDRTYARSKYALFSKTTDVTGRAVADHSAASCGRFTAILGSLSSESAPRLTSATHLWTVGPKMASNRQYCVTV